MTIPTRAIPYVCITLLSMLVMAFMAGIAVAKRSQVEPDQAQKAPASTLPMKRVTKILT